MIVVISRNPGYHEDQTGRPLAGEAGRIFDDALSEAALRREDLTILHLLQTRPPGGVFAAAPRHLLEADLRQLHLTLRRLKPKVIITLGDEAAHAVVPDWPDARSGSDLIHRGTIKTAREIENRRGYVFDSSFGPVVATVAPQSLTLDAKRKGWKALDWAPWRMLLSHDLRKAKEIARHGLIRPTREVTIVGSDRDARRSVDALRQHRVLATDIETWADTSLACVGFAGESGKAHVFPAQHLHRASELLSSPSVTTVWANGIYDLFVLKHREGVRFGGRVDDAQVAWHAAYPELAGQKEDKRGHRFTRKSLAFLASLATKDFYWKGDYNTDEEFFIYNGKDCMITLDVWAYVMQEVKTVGAEATYEHERGLMWPCVDMLARGLRVDERLRTERIEKLEASVEEVYAEADAVVLPWLAAQEERLEALGVLGLFQEIDPTCRCCGHGTKKQMSCWACAGFTSAPSKADLVERFNIKEKMTKAEAEERYLPVCHVCCGAPRETRLRVNYNSGDQMKALVYDVLGMPKKTKRNTKGESVLTVDEAALKNLLGGIT